MKPQQQQQWKADTLRWRHNENDSVSNHQPHGCLLNRLFRRRSKKTSKIRDTGLCVGNSPGPVNSPHKGPVTRKMLPFDDVIMSFNDSSNLYFYNLYNNSHILLMVILLQITLVKITNLQLAHVRCKWTEYLKCFLQLFGLLWDISRFPRYL